MELKRGDTFFPKSYMVPCSFACAKIPRTGIKTAVIAKPMVTKNQSCPDLNPKKGGSIKFPAPKNKENNANAVTNTSFDLFILLNSDYLEERDSININSFIFN